MSHPLPTLYHCMAVMNNRNLTMTGQFTRCSEGYCHVLCLIGPGMKDSHETVLVNFIHGPITSD